MQRLLIRLWLWLRGPRSVRQTFEFDDSEIRLVRLTRRYRPPPPGDDLRRPASPRAVAVELHSARGQTIFRRLLYHPVPQSLEVIGEHGRLQRVPIVPPAGTFSAVVPFDRRARRQVLVAGPEARLAQTGLAPRPGEEGRRRELLRVGLR